MKLFFKYFFRYLGNVIFLLSIFFLVASCFIAYKFRKDPQSAYLFGYKPIVVLTGSMEPTLRVNGTAIVRKVSYEDLNVGDILMYEIDGKMITHRVEEITPEGIRTKGDNNRQRDAYFLGPKNVRAKVVFIWNWTRIPLNQIFPEGVRGPRDNVKLALWIGVPLLLLFGIGAGFDALGKRMKKNAAEKEEKGADVVPEA